MPSQPEPTLEELEALRREGELLRESRERADREDMRAIIEAWHQAADGCVDPNCHICCNDDGPKVEVIRRRAKDSP